MIKSIEIKNFKSIKSKYFPLRNLNVLMGLNGQGKSSFIQALLLFRQSSESLKKGVLQLNGSLVNIGTTRDALYQYSKKNEGLSFGITFDDQETVWMNFDYVSGSDVFNRRKDLFNLNEFPVLTQSLFADCFQFLSAHRVKPQSIHQKSYTHVNTKSNIGPLGEYTVDYLETRGGEEVAFENLIHKNTASSKNNRGETIFDKRLINQVNLWMHEISPKINIKTTSVSSDLVKLEYEFEQETFGKTNAFKPENVGYGISNVLPVVVALLKARPGDLIIIENPESHIHPRGQAVLGRMISLLAQNDVQLIIETHSDHVINGIRIGVKENNPLRNRVILFYFEKVFSANEQYSRILNIEIDQQGELSEYPENLLDEWSNQLLKLL